MNLHLLRLFVAVAEAGSFSRAAEGLWISQPAVSKGIRELEHQLDLTLIERGTGKGFRLTEAGASLLTHARGIFAMERTALDDVRARVGVQRGSLTVGASTTVASYWLPPYVAGFCAAYPAVVPRVTVGNTQWVCEQLLECRIDLALVEGRVDEERLEVSEWKADPLAIVVAANSALPRRAVTAKVLGGQNWILREPGSGTRQATEALCEANGIAALPWMEMASNEAIARTVASGVGLSMLPRVVVADMLALGTLRELKLPGAVLSRPLYRLALKNRPLAPAALKMVELLERKGAASARAPRAPG
ncbi:DNA-binding transcriptional regulator, LysR family [Variovorax sp. OK605]|uniref:LysR substrate-binding domain-containing protein n=1 Tax=Variovorax sp. OK605 TaxID=1855317 RepID=UPI0008EC9C88|nr:LysR substrate-binding domain-containing protein [Variovorax sp. OK605]SFQ55319.1 DNA-binding transcriptional regulator, LysR family [Variovorax sp. OK605]